MSDPTLLSAGLIETCLAIGETSEGREVRYEVRNTSERVEFSPLKRALIYARDGQQCAGCGREGAYVLDHIVPRSSFLPDQVRMADRSDNLQCMCWDCNDWKSNKRSTFRSRLGVAPTCLVCAPDTYYDGDYPASTVRVFCGRCGGASSALSEDCYL